MSQTVGDQILERLAAWGVTHVFGYPGDGINGIMGAFNRNDHGCQFVQVRHEEMAAFMACGFAKMTGKVGVCLATSGPGAIHLLNGLYDAKMDHAAGRRDRRPGGDHGHGRLVPAGGRSPLALQGRGRRVRAHGDEPGPDPLPGRPRVPHGRERALRHVHHRPQERAGDAAPSRRRPTPTTPFTRARATTRRASSLPTWTCSGRPRF